MTSLMIDEKQLQPVSIDEYGLLDKLYPQFGDTALWQWRKRHFTCDADIEWTQYVADMKNGEGHVIIEISRIG